MTMIKKRKAGTSMGRLKLYLVLGSMLATWMSGDLLARQAVRATAVVPDAPMVVSEVRGQIPQVVARSRSSR